MPDPESDNKQTFSESDPIRLNVFGNNQTALYQAVEAVASSDQNNAATGQGRRSSLSYCVVLEKMSNIRRNFLKMCELYISLSFMSLCLQCGDEVLGCIIISSIRLSWC